MNKNCHRAKSFSSMTLPYRCNSYVNQLSQKWVSISVTLGLHRNYIYKEVSKTFFSVTVFVHRHFLYILNPGLSKASFTGDVEPNYFSLDFPTNLSPFFCPALAHCQIFWHNCNKEARLSHSSHVAYGVLYRSLLCNHCYQSFPPLWCHVKTCRKKENA